jgi:hypothetical protein
MIRNISHFALAQPDMDEVEKKPGNVYGENHPSTEDRRVPGIREEVAKDQEGTDETLEKTRQEDIATGQNSGGMGRSHTPRDGETQGTWDRPVEVEKRD